MTPPVKKYRCQLNGFTLCVKETADPHTLDCRATRKPRREALVIHVGTVLRLVSGRRRVRYVQARVFRPRLQYGSLVAGGLLEIVPGADVLVVENDV